METQQQFQGQEDIKVFVDTGFNNAISRFNEAGYSPGKITNKIKEELKAQLVKTINNFSKTTDIKGKFIEFVAETLGFAQLIRHQDTDENVQVLTDIELIAAIGFISWIINDFRIKP